MEFRKLLRVAVTFAIRSEFESWRRLGRFSAKGNQGRSLYRARIGDTEIRVLITGICCRSQGRQLQDLLSNSDLCIASGLAGGLRPQYPTGAVLVADAVRNGSAQAELAADERMVQAARRCGATSVARFLTSTVIVNSLAEKKRLSDIAAAVDMESFHVLTCAREAGIPAVAIRALSDGSDAPVPIDFNPFIDERGQIGWWSAVWGVAKAPSKVPQLIRFGIESSRAARNLSHFLDGYVRVLGSELFRVAM